MFFFKINPLTRLPNSITFCPVVSALQIAEMDLSSSIITTPALESIICRCNLLQCLSLEGLKLSDGIIRSVLSLLPLEF